MSDTAAVVTLRLDEHGRAVASPMKVAEILDCGLSRVYKMMDTGELPSFLIGGRRKIAITDIAAMVERKRAEGPNFRLMPWDRRGVAERRRWPRRDDPERGAKEPPPRPVGRPRKTDVGA